jgi:hypothetical protein
MADIRPWLGCKAKSTIVRPPHDSVESVVTFSDLAAIGSLVGGLAVVVMLADNE